jgi:hypothetical protein
MDHAKQLIDRILELGVNDCRHNESIYMWVLRTARRENFLPSLNKNQDKLAYILGLTDYQTLNFAT